MNNKYYYLVSSLPYLKFAEASPITRDEFLSECRKWLSGFDFAKVASVNIDSLDVTPQDAEVIKKWKYFELALRQELATIRKAHKSSLREKIPASLREIFEERTPLLMERSLQKKRWDFIEEEEFGYHFDTNVLMLYFLKLQILERLAVFDQERGKSAFEKLCEVGYE